MPEYEKEAFKNGCKIDKKIRIGVLGSQNDILEKEKRRNR